MREIYRSGVTPQQKLVAVNDKFGNNSVKNQQGTSRILYDSLKVTTGRTFYRFFEDSTTRAFPLTNTGSDGNKLGVGDTMVVSQILFTLWTLLDNGIWKYNGNLTQYSTGLAYIDLDIANNKVIKKLTLTESYPQFNKDTNGINNTVDLETQIVIPPLLQYTLDLQLGIPQTAPGEGEQYIVAQLIGTGGIIAPRTTF